MFIGYRSNLRNVKVVRVLHQMLKSEIEIHEKLREFSQRHLEMGQTTFARFHDGQLRAA